MRLWVDVDDTLIIWPHEAEQADTWKWNLDLIEAIRKYVRIYPETEVVIWSGGGVQYASDWAYKFEEIWNIPTHTLPKYVTQPSDNDIVVDDTPLNVSCSQFTPNEFVKWITPECLCWIKYRGSLTNSNMAVNSSKGFRI